MGQGKDDGEADAALSAFNADNVDPLQPGLIGQGLLGELPFPAFTEKNGADGRLKQGIRFHT